MATKNIKKSNNLKYLQSKRQKLLSEKNILEKATKENQNRLSRLNLEIQNSNSLTKYKIVSFRAKNQTIYFYT